MGRKDAEEPLKALVFADNCGAETQIKVGNLSSLLNLPILSWQLGVLARYGVKEAVVLSGQPIPSIFSDPLGRMKVTTLSSQSWVNEGDAIREVESRDDLRPVDDFVLVLPGSVFNFNVGQLVAAHKKRKEEDRNWLITTVLRKGAGAAKTGLVVGVDKSSGTLLKYLDCLDDKGITIDVNAENSGLQNGGRYEICSDVLDVGLDVCSPDFLLEFRENFYYDSVRAYIREKLEGGEAEVFGNRMYAHFMNSVTGEFGTRVSSLASLAQASFDILHGWISPISPSSITGIPYKDSSDDHQIDFLVEQSRVGENVSIALGSTIFESVIGNNVKIGMDVTIKRSIIMDGAVIHDRAEIEDSIISEGCIIHQQGFIPGNCFLDKDVCIGPDFMDMIPHSLITLRKAEEFLRGGECSDEDSVEEKEGEQEDVQNPDGEIEKVESTEKAWNEEHVGVGGKGRLLETSLSALIDPFFVPEDVREDIFESDEEDELEEELEEDEIGEQATANGDIDEIADQLSATGLSDSTPPEHSAVTDIEASNNILKFNEEMFETIERAEEENVEVENTVLEVNSLKLVYNCSFSETTVGIVAGLTLLAIRGSGPQQLYGAIDAALKKYEVLINKFGKPGDELHHLKVAEGLAGALKDHGKPLMYVYKSMFDLEMLEEEGILGWAAAEKAEIEKGRGNNALLSSVEPLIEWLENEETDDEDES